MPKLPGGMFRRGKSYYLRRQRDGKRQWINLGQDLPEACRLRKEALSSGVGSGSQIPVRKLAVQWLGTYVCTMRAPLSQKKAAQRVRDYLVPFLGEKPIARVTKEDLRAYRAWLDGRPISPQTVVHILADARCFFRWAEDAGYIERSPWPRRLRRQNEPMPVCRSDVVKR